jgi:hypothetical protein
MKQTVLEEVVDSVTPAKKRKLTKKRVMTGVTIAANVLAVLVLKKPALAPVLQVLNSLLAVSNDSPDHHTKKVLGQVRALKTKLETAATEAEQAKLRGKLEALYELLELNDEEDT